jgi:hypothetical protein
MVEEAERTNSPSSCSLVTACFEVIPSSLASSWTRALATFLLSRPAPDRYEPFNSYFGIPGRNGRLQSTMKGSSGSTHRWVLIGFPSVFDPLSVGQFVFHFLRHRSWTTRSPPRPRCVLRRAGRVRRLDA